MKKVLRIAMLITCAALALTPPAAHAQDWWKPYTAPCTERENVFAFTQKPTVKLVQKDKYEISFAVKGNCDVTVAMVDEKGVVVRHLGSGVLGANAPAPFQKNSLKQKIYWNGKDDLDYYVKEPEKLKLRVSLGLKPESDRLLGAVSPHNLPGYVAGMAASEEGVFVFTRGGRSVPGNRYTVRHFDHDGEYAKTVWPPPASLPREKLNGLWWVEYEPGKWSVQGADENPNYWGRSLWMGAVMEWAGPGVVRPAVVGSRILFSCNGDYTGVRGKPAQPRLRWIHTDGSTDVRGIEGRIYFAAKGPCFAPRLAASPDGRTVYMVGLETSSKHGVAQPVVLSFPLDGKEKAKVFAGKMNAHGSDDTHLNQPRDVACDASGRVYVADELNGRVQVFSDKGELLKSIKAFSPHAVQIHQKTGAVYVAHAGRERGKRTERVTKFKPFPALSEEFHQDGVGGDAFVLDSWSARPRLWLGRQGSRERVSNLIVWEETGNGFKPLIDFNARAKKDAGTNYHGRWSGDNHGAHANCDPTRERVHLGRHKSFDLRTGKFLGDLSVGRRIGDNIAFDKRGYMHIEYGYSHVARVDPDRKASGMEVPYDYGEEKDGWIGPISLPRVGRHPYGMGVNMRGDVAVVLGTEKIPKMETEQALNTGRSARVGPLGMTGGTYNATTEFFRALAEDEKRGITVPFVPRRPGHPLGFGTIWTWDSSGEEREQMTVIAGQRINGVQMDEDGKLYFSNARLRMRNGKPFLEERAVRQGTDERITPFTGTYMKTTGTKVRFLCRDAAIPMNPWPTRQPDLSGPWGYSGYGTRIPVWVEGAEWFCAGASPMKPSDCSCYQLRAHLDWYKRSYVPELYRHSIGILDTNGNLVMHAGEYGNYDSTRDRIASTFIRFVSGTDNYLCFEDWGERLTVLKLSYHAEETVGIK